MAPSPHPRAHAVAIPNPLPLTRTQVVTALEVAKGAAEKAVGVFQEEVGKQMGTGAGEYLPRSMTRT